MGSYVRLWTWLVLCGCFCLVGLELGHHAVESARLAATIAAKDEAAAKRDQAKSAEELQKEKERFEKLTREIENLLQDSKDYKKALLRKQQEEEAREFTPQELEDTALWRKEYENFINAGEHKERWERLGIVAAVGAAASAGLAAYGKAHENMGGVVRDPSSAQLVKHAGTTALLGGSLALISWLMRRQNKKKQKLHNARLARMQFEARTGLKPSDENVLGPDESLILIPPKKKHEKKVDE
ncbi:uncharacterized protein LOC34620443 [Cyclospora cayetanensis]|uniref:Uncharacterized protein LOC34620443 n=1 Tax=Cyclospora cayetanensis TaxID=88456 RepID=A0A6P5WDE1_9EIME|nr:uncharacterized protein LOC34620443 [Cyclospora cayetanensis]